MLQTMSVQPTAFGNIDADEWPPGRDERLPQRFGAVIPGQDVPHVLVVEAYPNPLPRKCVWAMLLLSCLLVLRVQQDRYTDVVRWTGGGVPDTGQPFPWETQPLVSANDTYQATFLSPIIRRASTFMNSNSAPMMIAGLPRLVVTGSSGDDATAVQSVTPGVVAIAGGFKLAPPVCGRGSDCFVGVQRLPPYVTAASLLTDGNSRKVPGLLVTCHRFVAGASATELHALVPVGKKVNGSQAFCVRSKRIHSLASSASKESSAVVAWDPIGSTKVNLSPRPAAGTGLDQALRSSRMLTCLAAVSLHSGAAEVGPVALVDAAVTVLYDQGSQSLVTIGFTSTQMITVHQYDSVTLKPMVTYRLPMMVAWLLRAERLADGFLLFVGAEEPFTGSIFTIDLRRSEVFEQDPPTLGGSGQMPKRKKLPRRMVIDDDPASNQNYGGTAKSSLCASELIADPGPQTSSMTGDSPSNEAAPTTAGGPSTKAKSEGSS